MRPSLPLLVLLILSALAGAAPARAETAEEKGQRIAVEADRRNRGWSDTSANLTMTLSNSQGDTSIRTLRIKALESLDAKVGDKGLVIFDQPHDVKGTALLTFAKVLDPDDQWIYLPAVKLVKRISSVNKSGPFMGSEFSYEDLAPQNIGKFRHKWLRDEDCPGEAKGLPCFVVERTPLYEYSGYTREIMWIDSRDYLTWQVVYYDQQETPLKTLTMSNYRKYLDKFFRPLRLDMINHRNGKSTRLEWSSFAFRSGLTDQDFSQANLNSDN